MRPRRGRKIETTELNFELRTICETAAAFISYLPPPCARPTAVPYAGAGATWPAPSLSPARNHQRAHWFAPNRSLWRSRSLPPQPRRSTAVPRPRPRLARPSPRQLRLISPSSPSSRAYKRQARASSRAHLDHPEPPWPPLPVNSASPSSSHFRAFSPRASPLNGFLSTY